MGLKKKESKRTNRGKKNNKITAQRYLASDQDLTHIFAYS